MQLFENDSIVINKIYSVNKYDTTHNASPTAEYGTVMYFHELIFILSGKGEVFVDGVNLSDRPDTIRYLRKGHSRSRYIVSRSVPGTCIDIYFDTDSPMPDTALAMANCDALRDKFLKIHALWQKKDVGYYADAMSVFYEIIAYFQKQKAQNYLSVEQKDSMQLAYDYLSEHYLRHDFDYKALCHSTGLEYARFSELFKKRFSVSPVKLVTKMRIDHAKELLITGRFTVSEIAEQCGFENVYYFSNVFKKHTGFSPSVYPRTIR